MNIFNEGDKILCKKKLTDHYTTRFIEGQYYIFHIILDDVFEIYEYCVFDDSNDMMYPYFFDENEFRNHFYMKNEVRKIKLKKLYEETGY